MQRRQRFIDDLIDSTAAEFDIVDLVQWISAREYGRCCVIAFTPHTSHLTHLTTLPTPHTPHLNDIHVSQLQPAQALPHRPERALPAKIKHLRHVLLVPPHFRRDKVGLPRHVSQSITEYALAETLPVPVRAIKSMPKNSLCECRGRGEYHGAVSI